MENTNPISYDEVLFTTIKDLIKNCEEKDDQLEKLQEVLAKFELRNERVRTELPSSDVELGDDDDDEDDSRHDNRPTEPEQKGEEIDPWFESSPVSWPEMRDRHYDPRVHGPRHVIHGTGSNQDDEYTAFVYRPSDLLWLVCLLYF